MHMYTHIESNHLIFSQQREYNDICVHAFPKLHTPPTQTEATDDLFQVM